MIGSRAGGQLNIRGRPKGGQFPDLDRHRRAAAQVVAPASLRAADAWAMATRSASSAPYSVLGAAPYTLIAQTTMVRDRPPAERGPAAVAGFLAPDPTSPS